MARTIFITGTDTGVGKTHVTCGLLLAAREQGLVACGYKPVASGSRRTAQGLVNEDARQLQQCSAGELPLSRINPYALRSPVAPHLAALEDGVQLSLARLSAGHRWLAARHELVLVEGAGGWQVPLDRRHTLADWVTERGWPVVLVVGMRLGCINHALLSAESILRRSPLLGWVANLVPPRQPRWQENVDELQRRLPAPLLGVVRPGRRVLDSELALALGQLRSES